MESGAGTRAVSRLAEGGGLRTGDPTEPRSLAGQPEFTDRAQETFEGNRFGRLHHEGIGAQLVGLIDICRQCRRGEHNYGHEPGFRVIAHPPYDLEAPHPRHFEIDDDQAGKRKSNSIRVSLRSAEIFYGFEPVRDRAQRVPKLRLLEGPFDQQNIVGVVLDQKNWVTRVHGTEP